MMRSMFSGISGLRIHQTKMDVIANNISNVNTVGYKSSRVTFNEVFSQTIAGASGADDRTGSGGINPMQIGLGANVSSIDKRMTQGAAQRTDNPFDLMIQGDGFLIVGNDAGTYFTRAGAMNLDSSGNLVTNTGLKVLGWDTQINPTSKQLEIAKDKVAPIMIVGDKEYSSPKPTTLIDFSGNINALTYPEQKNTIAFFDTVGNRYVIDTKMVYNPSSSNSSGDTSAWEVRIGNVAYINGNKDNAIAITVSEDGTINFTGDELPQAVSFEGLVGEVIFDTNGLIVAMDPPHAMGGTATGMSRIALTLNSPEASGVLLPSAKFGDGANQIQLDFSNVTQFGNESANCTTENRDGNEPGNLNGISIASDGKITGRYSNGQTKLLGMIPVAMFKNPAGLEKIGDNLFVPTANSGGFDQFGVEIKANGGSFLGGVLEMSNVDLASEFTDMITTQRGFQANSRVITTSDDMLQELVNLKR